MVFQYHSFQSFAIPLYWNYIHQSFHWVSRDCRNRFLSSNFVPLVSVANMIRCIDHANIVAGGPRLHDGGEHEGPHVLLRGGRLQHRGHQSAQKSCPHCPPWPHSCYQGSQKPRQHGLPSPHPCQFWLPNAQMVLNRVKCEQPVKCHLSAPNVDSRFKPCCSQPDVWKSAINQKWKWSFLIDEGCNDQSLERNEPTY